jgi:hypothetical protein
LQPETEAPSHSPVQSTIALTDRQYAVYMKLVEEWRAAAGLQRPGRAEREELKARAIEEAT